MSLSSAELVDRMREREAMAKDLFMQYDTNGDGVLDFEEMTTMVRDLLPDIDEEGEEAMRQEFVSLDRDGNENIDFPEFVLYYNKMISYQGGNTHSYEQGGAATDFWGAGDQQNHHRLIKRLHGRKKLTDDEFHRITFMLNSKYMILDLKAAFAFYNRAETILPLKRLLKKVGPQVDQQRSLAKKFWSMSHAEIDSAKSQADQWQAMGIITFDEYLQLRDLLDRRVMMTELKAVMDTNNTNLLKQVLRAAKDQDQEAGDKLYSSNQTFHRTSSKQALSFGESGFLPPIESVGVNDRNFELTYAPLKHNTRSHSVMVPTLNHRTMTKPEYLSFCKTVNKFMGDDEDVMFDDDVVQKLLHVVAGLVAAGFLSGRLANKAKEFIREGDRFVVYAIYQYDKAPGALTTYLLYKQNEEDKIRKEVKGMRRNIQRRKSMDLFMAERKEVLALARQQHATGIQQHRDHKEALVQAEHDAAEEEERLKNEEEEHRKQTHKPRWLLLYEAKFTSYNDLLYDKKTLQQTVIDASISK